MQLEANQRKNVETEKMRDFFEQAVPLTVKLLHNGMLFFYLILPKRKNSITRTRYVRE